MNLRLVEKIVLWLVFLVSFSSRLCFALPFSAETTTRESVPRVPYPLPTPQQLYDDSYELTFQKLSNGQIFLAFVSKDPAADNYYDDENVYREGACVNDGGLRHVYWLDRASGGSARCIDVNLRTGTPTPSDRDAFNPKIGGAGHESGRYVAFESDSEILIPPTPTPNPSITPTATPNGYVPPALEKQIFIHDRKWEHTTLSTGKCTFSESEGFIPNGPSYISRISRDGSHILFSSEATNIIDNLQPVCTDSNGPIADVFDRNGANCVTGTFGPCYTSVVYDRYHYHA
ncbi:MAG: hypothetical protein GYA55_04985, partial [SAR324 cluster bacterium]|nr:hypothetical protein [SAR324 cluster bacterium]